ncbi:MAG TPA: heavy metal-binding domain-containing protein, partial [Dehalococcoidales bacterium]|nr:heavy metal-binding domain-containing protein [Dehalococcoidales bacterium]
MIITTAERIEGKNITKTVGLVKGSTIRARHVGRDIMAGLRGIVGGEITDYTK